MCEIQLNGKRQCLQSSSSTHGGAVDFPHSYTSTYPISVALSDSVSTDLVAAVSSVDKQERQLEAKTPTHQPAIKMNPEPVVIVSAARTPIGEI